jgi:hypothetical protein
VLPPLLDYGLDVETFLDMSEAVQAATVEASVRHDEHERQIELLTPAGRSQIEATDVSRPWYERLLRLILRR